MALTLMALWKLADWQCERWWFQSAGYTDQWNQLWAWRGGCFAGGAMLMALWLGLNAQIAWHHTSHSLVPLKFFETPSPPLLIPLDDKLRLDRYRRSFTLWTIATLSWLTGLSCAARYTLFLRAFYFQSISQTDAASNLNLGFFLFRLPLLEWISYFVLSAILAALVIVSAIYIYESALFFGEPSRQANQKAPLRHIALLWALLLLWKGADSLLGILSSFVSAGNVATRVFDAIDLGFGFTSATLFTLSTPLVALFSALAITNRPRYRLFLLGLGWMMCGTILPRLLPLVVGRPLKNAAWQGAIARHIHSTRRAWGLDSVEKRTLGHVPIASSKSWQESALSDDFAPQLPVALWPAESAREAMNARLTAQKSRLRVAQLDLERRENDLRYVGVALPSAPIIEEAPNGAMPPGQLLEMEATRTTSEGSPIFTSAVPVRVNFGAWAALSSETADDDELLSNQPVNRKILAQTNAVQGVDLKKWAVRTTLAARFFEPRLVQPSSSEKRLIWHRGAASRCRQIAPFLTWPVEEAQPVLVNTAPNTHRLLWIVPGLVWTNDYPDSATPALGAAPYEANYGRQIAVGVVDAQSGQVQLFYLDADEPFMALYRRAFPHLFQTVAALAPGIRAQIRPSPSLWRAQALIWARYHDDNIESWIKVADAWRPLFSPTEEDETAPRVLAAESSGDWQIMAFTRDAEQANGSNALISLLGADERRFGFEGGKLRWVNWTAASALPLPALLDEPLPRLIEHRPYPPLPTFSGLAPQFDTRGNVTALLAIRGTVESVENPDHTPPPSLHLSAHIAVAGSTPFTVASRGDAPRMATLRSAWRALVEGRQQGDWNAVARAEKQINQLLGSP